MTHLVLAGGGHANALALAQLAGGGGARPLKPPQRLTLVSESSETPYSGMLPGWIAGHYRRTDCFISLPRLAAAAGADFIAGQVAGIDGKHLLLADGSRLAFDVLSLNTGALPPPAAIPAAARDSVCAVKPIDDFIRWLSRQDNSAFARIAVVGAGAGGIETMLALLNRWRDKAPRPSFILIGEVFLPDAPAAMRRTVRRWLLSGGVDIIAARVLDYDGAQLRLSDGRRLPCCRLIYALPVAAAPWFRQTALPLDAGGFIRVNDYLQSPARADIFISGDAAAVSPPLPKAGVMAVRQGKILAHNLPLAAGWRRGAMRRFSASRRALFIIGAGDGCRAVAARNGLTVSGRWIWRWKQYLDFAFIKKLRL